MDEMEEKDINTFYYELKGNLIIMYKRDNDFSTRVFDKSDEKILEGMLVCGGFIDMGDAKKDVDTVKKYIDDHLTFGHKAFPGSFPLQKPAIVYALTQNDIPILFEK